MEEGENEGVGLYVPTALLPPPPPLWPCRTDELCRCGEPRELAASMLDASGAPEPWWPPLRLPLWLLVRLLKCV